MVAKRSRISTTVPLCRPLGPCWASTPVFHLDEGRVGLGVFRGAESRLHAETGHGRDARQGFAAEPEGADVPEIVHAGYFAGGVACDGQLQLGGGDARAVVPDPDEALPPFSSVTSINVAPASRLFSTSSLTTLAGRSTTSPAAI